MKIDQDLSIGVFFSGVIRIVICVLVTIMIPYLYIDQYLRGSLSISLIIASPIFLLLMVGMWLLSLFLFTYSLPRSIILNKKEITIVQPRFWTPWRKVEIKIPIKDITKVEHHDRRLYIFLKNNLIYNYHVPNLKEKNLKKIEMVKTFLAKEGIFETNQNEYQMIKKTKMKKLKKNEIKITRKAIKEFPSGTTTIRYLLVNWRAMGLILILSSIPLLVIIVFTWYDSKNLSALELISNYRVHIGFLGSLLFFVFFSIISFPMFIWSLKKSKVILTDNEIVVLSKINPFFPIIENRFAISSVKRMIAIKEQ